MVDLSLDALARRYASGATVAEVCTEVLDACAAAPGGIWIQLADPAAIAARAAALDAMADARSRLALYGVPVAVKDNIDVAGLDTTAGCPAFAYRPEHDAGVVARLLDAGAVVVGKTNLDQFATGLTGTRSPYGVPDNPLAPGFVAGGSSSGSAVAVALGLVTAALGTDTAGSGRVPAACTGTVGWKPAPGTWTTAGVVPACRSLDCVSVFGRDVQTALTFAGVLGGEPITGLPGRLSVAVPDDASAAAWAPSTVRSLGFAIDGLVEAGHEIVPVDLAPWLEAGRLLYDGPWIAERTAALGDFLRGHPDEVVPVVRDLILGGAAWSAQDSFRAAAHLDRLRDAVDRWWRAADVLLLPTCDQVPTVAQALADPVGSSAQLGALTNAANLLGLAAVAFPGPTRPEMPFGLSAFAPVGRERALAAVAGAPVSDRPSPSGPYDLAVVGAHLRGQPLNGLLTRRGARLVRETTTAPSYRLWRLAAGPVPRPGLERVGQGGRAIEVEVWRLDPGAFAAVVSEVAEPLGIGSVQLADGSWVRGFVCEPIGLDDALDITEFGGWRAAQA